MTQTSAHPTPDAFFANPPTGELEWVALNGFAEHPKSTALLATLVRLKTGYEDEAGKMSICLESATGAPLLVVRGEGFNNWMEVVLAFEGEGLVDRLENNTLPHEVFDAIFR